MKKWYYLPIAISLLFLSCKQKTALVIPEDQLVKVLVDVHVAEAAVHSLYGEVKDSTIAKYYDQVYEIHDIDATTFDAAMQQLRNDPALLNQVYAKVLDEVKLLDASTD